MLKLCSAFACAVLLAAPAVFGAPEALDATPVTRLDPSLRCHLGAYALPQGRAISITGSDGAPRALSYTLSTGEFGVLNEKGQGEFSSGKLTISFAPCASGVIRLKTDGPGETGNKILLTERDVAFDSDGVKLHGKLVSPTGGGDHAIAVWIEGSNNNPSTDDTVWQYELARRGVGVFVYDKRGVGASAGAQTSDFYARARDTASAIQMVRQLSPNAKKVGVIGASQGGWVAPLTADIATMDFVVTAYGMAEGPIAQDMALVEQQMLKAGFGSDELTQSRELTSITARIVRTNLQEGAVLDEALSDLEAFKAKYAKAAWIDAIQPRSYSGIFLHTSTADIKVHGPALAQGLPFGYEPRPVIERIKPRQLWLLGGSDQQAPNAGTQKVLKDIQRRRSDLAVVVFPRADHGLIETLETPAGPKPGYSPEQFDIVADWINDRRLPSDSAFITLP